MIKKIHAGRLMKTALVASCLSVSLVISATADVQSNLSENINELEMPTKLEQNMQKQQQTLVKSSSNNSSATSASSKEIAYNIGVLLFYPMSQLAHLFRYTLDTRPKKLNEAIQNQMVETDASQALANTSLQSLFFYDQAGLNNSATQSILNSNNALLKAPFFYSTHSPGYLNHQTPDNNQTTLINDILSDFDRFNSQSGQSSFNQQLLTNNPSSPLVICPYTMKPTKSNGLLGGATYVSPRCAYITANTLLGTTEYKRTNISRQNAAEQFTSIASGNYVGLTPPDPTWYSADNSTKAPVAQYIALYQTSRALKSIGAYNLGHAYSIRTPGRTRKNGDQPSALTQYNNLLVKMATNPEFWSRVNSVPVIGQLTIIADYMPIIAFGVARENQQLEMINNSLAAMLIAQTIFLQQAGTTLYNDAKKATASSSDAETIPVDNSSSSSTTSSEGTDISSSSSTN